ncbi:uncharacterized protein LOC110847333 [Folsomia candida]|uniref:Uncharacterized protein n=1 Tax=Folsomia candida TaxID=158441 RepID=A0A226EHK1_FOLCA|nr:uncharacterized protein LOC110847333 [Folsomia candida]OXA57173.1 hypothetical protein Fcan01_06662 [Folsomia candida]
MVSKIQRLVSIYLFSTIITTSSIHGVSPMVIKEVLPSVELSPPDYQALLGQINIDLPNDHLNSVYSEANNTDLDDPLIVDSQQQRMSRVDIDLISEGDKPKFYRIRIPRSPQHFSGGKHYGYGSGTKAHTNFGFGRPGHHGSQAIPPRENYDLGGLKPQPRSRQ